MVEPVLLELATLGAVVEAAGPDDAVYKLTSVLVPKISSKLPVAARLMDAVEVHNIAYSPRPLTFVGAWAQ